MRLNIYSLIYFLNSYINGLLVPVLSLVLMDKGASLSNLSLIMGMYAVTVVVFELPTGIMADMIGRKKTFCISLIISLISSLFLLFGGSIAAVCIAIVLQGLTRAISSGSFEALFIDSYIDAFGKDALHKVTTRLSVLDALGLSAGALTGGLFPEIAKDYVILAGTYDLNLIVKIFLTVIAAVLAFVFIKETTEIDTKERVSLKQHIKNSSAFIVKSKTIICILISVFSTGFFLYALETYWQPHFIFLMEDKGLLVLLGVMAFLYLAAAMAGHITSGIIIKRINTKKIYLVLRLFLAFSVILMALQLNIVSFIVMYTIVYFVFGMANIPEGVILNTEVPNEIRASVLSVNSLILQAGGLIGSVVNSLIINYTSIPVVWIISSGVIILSILLTFKGLMGNQTNNYEDNLASEKSE